MDHVLKEEKFDTMKCDVCEMRQTVHNKSWADACKENVVFGISHMHGGPNVKNREHIDAQEMYERKKRAKNVVISCIKETKEETPQSLT